MHNGLPAGYRQVDDEIPCLDGHLDFDAGCAPWARGPPQLETADALKFTRTWYSR